MRSIYQKISNKLGLSLFAMFAVAAMAVPQAHATSGNATIYNAVTVSYTAGASTLTASASATVTVATLGAQPAVSISTAAADVVTNDPYTLTVTVISNANGLDDYYTAVSSVNAGVGAPTGLAASVTSLNLWGGIVVTSVDGLISIPNGSEAGLTLGDTIRIGTTNYTVGTITSGAAATGDGVGANAETYTTVAVAGLLAADAPAGTPVGEVGTYTVSITNAGVPSTPGTNGTHTITTDVTPAATNLAGAAITKVSVNSILTVKSPSLSITKVSDVTSAKPGANITYTITVKQWYI